MTDREKLIGLIGQVQYLGGLELALADHLLANGVTIPVRCKDCKWWRDFDCMNANGASSLVLNEDFFCAAGERKNGF